MNNNGEPNKERGSKGSGEEPKRRSGCKKRKTTQQHAPPADHHNQENEYIHVRARRSQATDSHSLAERVRRQKISERMKVLQTLVPGCQKVSGKALMLDEIINYVQSLQNQVEFLSMELASVNNFGIMADDINPQLLPTPSQIIITGNHHHHHHQLPYNYYNITSYDDDDNDNYAFQATGGLGNTTSLLHHHHLS